MKQCANKVMSDSPGLVDSTVKLADSVEQLKPLGNIFQELI